MRTRPPLQDRNSPHHDRVVVALPLGGRCAWTDRRKACAEILLSTLVHKYPTQACPTIYHLFTEFLQSASYFY